MDLNLVLIIYIGVINIAAFFTMDYDKKLAISGRRRISEKTIFTLAIMLGSIGIYAGMYKFRHKTKHMKFVILIPIIIAINCVSTYYLFHMLK